MARDITNIVTAHSQKVLLEEVSLSGKGEMEVGAEPEAVRRKLSPRAGWAEHFKQITEEGQDALLDAEFLTRTHWDQTEWQW